MATNVRFFKIKHFDNYETDFKDKSISDIVGSNNFYEEAFYLNSNDGSLYLGNQKLSNAQEVQQLIENFEQLYDFQREITTTNTDGTVTTETIDYSDIDKGKAIRTIAIEELSYQLLSDKAEADFKTLQELGAWIEDHPESVAEMNFAIQNNSKDIDDIQLDIMRLDVQPDWELDNDQSHAYIQNKPMVKKGSKSTSIAIGDSIANGEYSIAAGTNDTSLAGSFGSIGSVDKPIAQGDMSISLGAGTKSIAAGTVAIGANSSAGCKGFYFWSIDFTNKVITLSTNQKPIILGTRKWTNDAITQLKGWAINDIVSIVNSNKYVLCSKITAIDSTKGTITVDNLPFTETQTELIPLFYDYSVCCPSKPTVGIVEVSLGGFALGLQNKASGSFSHVEGWNNIGAGDFSHVEGRDNIAGYASHAEGSGTNSLGHYSHTEGQKTTAIGKATHIEGVSDDVVENYMTLSDSELLKAWNTSKFALAKGAAAHVEGKNNLGLGLLSHAEGENNIAQGEKSHVEGASNKAVGIYSHAEGVNTRAIGAQSHSEGSKTSVTGNHSHIEGTSDNIAESVGVTTSSNVEEIQNLWNTSKFALAKGAASHVEGKNNLALQAMVHVEGENNIGNNYHVHVEGYNNKADGDKSHVEGAFNVAKGKYQHVQGCYNDYTNIASNVIHIVGNGTSDSKRSNAHTLDNQGNAWYAGTLKVGGTSYSDGTEVALKTDISSLTTKVNNNTSNISSLTTKVNALENNIPTNIVDLSSTQTITGVKTFQNSLKIGNATLTYTSNGLVINVS